MTSSAKGKKRQSFYLGLLLPLGIFLFQCTVNDPNGDTYQIPGQNRDNGGPEPSLYDPCETFDVDSIDDVNTRSTNASERFTSNLTIDGTTQEDNFYLSLNITQRRSSDSSPDDPAEPKIWMRYSDFGSEEQGFYITTGIERPVKGVKTISVDPVRISLLYYRCDATPCFTEKYIAGEFIDIQDMTSNYGSGSIEFTGDDTTPLMINFNQVNLEDTGRSTTKTISGSIFGPNSCID